MLSWLKFSGKVGDSERSTNLKCVYKVAGDGLSTLQEEQPVL